MPSRRSHSLDRGLQPTITSTLLESPCWLCVCKEISRTTYSRSGSIWRLCYLAGITPPRLDGNPSSFRLVSIGHGQNHCMYEQNYVLPWSLDRCTRTQDCHLAQHLLKKCFPQRRSPFPLHELWKQVVAWRYTLAPCILSMTNDTQLTQNNTPAERNAISDWYFLHIASISDWLSSSATSCDQTGLDGDSVQTWPLKQKIASSSDKVDVKHQ